MDAKDAVTEVTMKPVYEKPDVKRIDLALDETLTAGCKVGGTECTSGFPPISEGGS